MSEADLVPLVQSLAGARVLCVGDVMLDHYVYGRVERVSPEAPIPVLHVERERKTLGGAGNVLRNLQALGLEPCLVSVTGNDRAAREIGQLLAALAGAEAHVLSDRTRTTTIKTRYVAGTQQMLRADREQAGPLSTSLREDFLRMVRQVLPQHRAIVLSDYAKGVLGEGIAGEIIAAAKAQGHAVVIDPKGSDYGRYQGATLVKPNRAELAAATGRPVGDDGEIAAAARALIDAHGFAAVLVSLSQDGMMLVEAEGAIHRLAAQAREVYDVSGAGDTAVAVLGAALAVGASFRDAARLANVAAGIVVGKVGTAIAPIGELIETLLSAHSPAPRKVVTAELALDQIERWRRNGLKIAFTNGCFDLLHPGHVSLLDQARRTADRLVVGLNSDASVVRLKGPGRPVQSAEARSQVLASLASVDLVVVFDEDTPRALIGELRPDVLVKGADYRLDEVVGGDIVASYGGKVVLADLLPGHSTTATIARIAR